MLFSSDRDDSFIKLHEAFSVLFAARFRIVHMLVSISKNRNYNGFDLIVLKFPYAYVLSFRCVAVFLLLLVFLPRFPD